MLGLVPVLVLGLLLFRLVRFCLVLRGRRDATLPQMEEKEGEQHPAELRHGDAEAEEEGCGPYAVPMKEK